MKLTADLHTHTVFSHGKGTIREMVERAKEMGLETIVISDHGSGHPFFGVKRGQFKRMRKEIDGLAKEFDDLQIYLSVEANIIGADGTLDIGEEELEYCDFIYAGYHYGYIPKSIGDFFGFTLRNYACRLFKSLEHKMQAIATDAYLQMMERYDLKMITHPGDKMPIDIDQVARKAAEKNVILEINPRHGHLNADEIKIAMAYDVQFAVNSDAHTVTNLGNVTGIEQILRESGLSVDRIVNMTE